MLDQLLDRMIGHMFHRGRIEITLPSGRVIAHGDSAGGVVRIKVSDPSLVRKALIEPDLSVGEAYMDGRLTIENDDLRGFLAMATQDQFEGQSYWVQKPIEALHGMTRRLSQHNSRRRSRRNVAHHYDLSEELYSLFLDKDRQYSCAYFKTPQDTLEQAQEQKKQHIAKKLLIEPGMRVLDIGCGWGGMGLTLARDYGARVIGVTLSTEQHEVATRRAKEAGLEDRVEFRLQDYREVPETFDRIVSVGMFEHVGVPHFREYFRHVHDRLTHDGIALIHTIGRAGAPGYTGKFIEKYIFPGGYIPSMSEVMQAIEHETLYTTDVEVLRLHYAETLKAWDERFEANIDRVREIYDEEFCRMWRFYLIGSEMAFRSGFHNVFQFQLARRQDAVPLTRDYLYAPDKPEPAPVRAKPVKAAKLETPEKVTQE